MGKTVSELMSSNITNAQINVKAWGDIVINVKAYGAKGDGVHDDTAAIQKAFTAASGSHLWIPEDFNGRITGRITMPENIVISGGGQFTCDGDQDYWFYADNPERIIFERFRASLTTAFASRTLLNRVIYCGTPTYFEIMDAEIVGASTAVHCFNGEDFICGNIILRNVFGTAAQYGYGLNSSAKRFSVQMLTVQNDDVTNGRHAVYINGDQWENAVIGSVYVKNWNKNPIEITNTSTSSKSFVYVGSSVFVNVNINPAADSAGCINIGSLNTSGVRVHVESMRVNNIAGPAMSSQGMNNGAYLGSLYAENLAEAANVNIYLINFRNGINHRIGKVICTSLNTNWVSAIFLRDTTNTIVDDVYIGGSVGSQAIRLNNADALLGNIQTASIDRIFQSGGTVRYKNLTTGTRTFSAGGSINTVTISHGLGTTPSYWNVQKAISGLPAIDFVTADATTLTVTFVSPPPAGTNNVVLKWAARI